MIYNIELSADDLNLIGFALGKLPLEQAMPLFSRLQADAATQNLAAKTSPVGVSSAGSEEDTEAAA